MHCLVVIFDGNFETKDGPCRKNATDEPQLEPRTALSAVY
jgi:hypothetical protein